MTGNIYKEIDLLGRLTVRQLRAKHLEVFGEPTGSGHKEYLIKRIAWRIQANARGDLSARARQRAEELAHDADLRTTAPKTPAAPELNVGSAGEAVAVGGGHDPRLPMAGTIIRRRYHGRCIAVRVLPKGFEFEGQIYRSLTAVAKTVTGSQWNGYAFFNLSRRGGADE